MAWIRLLQPYNNEAPGAIIEVPGGLASVLILRGVAQVSATRHETEPPPTAPSPRKPRKPRNPRNPRKP